MRVLIVGLIAFLAMSDAVIADTYSILSLGTRKDAATWEKGMRGLGMTKGVVIAKPNPTLAEIKSFFLRSDHALFIAGHYGGYLYNHDSSIKIYFHDGKVVVKHGNQSSELSVGSGFKQHQKLKALFWGGCSVHSQASRINTHRSLFGKTVISIGWKGITGWQIVDLMCGGKGDGDSVMPDHFFKLMNGNLTYGKMADHWMKAANQIDWGAGFRGRFSVIDSNGRQYLLKGDAVNGGVEEGQDYK